MKKIILLLLLLIMVATLIINYISYSPVHLKSNTILHYRIKNVSLVKGVYIFNDIFSFAKFECEKYGYAVYIIIKEKNGSETTITYTPKGCPVDKRVFRISREDLNSDYVYSRYGVVDSIGRILDGKLTINIIEANNDKIKICAIIDASILYYEEDKMENIHREEIYYIDLNTQKVFKENGEHIGYTLLILNPSKFYRKSLALGKVELKVEDWFINPYYTSIGKINCVQGKAYLIDVIPYIYIPKKESIGWYLYSKDIGILINVRSGVFLDAILNNMLDVNLLGPIFKKNRVFRLEGIENMKVNEYVYIPNIIEIIIMLIVSITIFVVKNK